MVPQGHCRWGRLDPHPLQILESFSLYSLLHWWHVLASAGSSRCACAFSAHLGHMSQLHCLHPSRVEPFNTIRGPR